MLTLLMLLLGGGAMGAALVLADSPTRVRMPHRVAKTGDAVPIRETLMDKDGVPQDLNGATVVFTLIGPDGVTKLVDRAATSVLQTGSGASASKKGQVSYTIPATTAIPAGVSSWEFEASWDEDTVLTFPDDANGTLTLIAALG